MGGSDGFDSYDTADRSREEDARAPWKGSNVGAGLGRRYEQRGSDRPVQIGEGSNAAGLPEVRLDGRPGSRARGMGLDDGRGDVDGPWDGVERPGVAGGVGPGSLSQSGTLQRQTETLMARMVPIKVMMFVDGTWLYYSFFARGRSRCTIAKRYGENWFERHAVDWAAFQHHIAETISYRLPGRLVDVFRVIVFGSVRRDTRAQSPRIRMFQEMEQANFEVHLLTHGGDQVAPASAPPFLEAPLSCRTLSLWQRATRRL